MEDLMTQEAIEFERKLAAESAIETDTTDEICPCGDPDCFRPFGHDEEHETPFAEQLENQDFAQDDDFSNMHPSEEFEGCWEN